MGLHLPLPLLHICVTVSNHIHRYLEVSTADKEVSTADKEVSTADKEVSTADKEVSAADKEVSIADKEVSAADKEVSTADKEVSAADNTDLKREFTMFNTSESRVGCHAARRSSLRGNVAEAFRHERVASLAPRAAQNVTLHFTEGL
jgi:guanylate cyclase 2D/E/F